MNSFDLENFPTSDAGKRMLDYIATDFYEQSYVGKWLFQIMGEEWDKAKKIFEELPLQMFPETATWGLKYHEQKWQLAVKEHLGYEERRKQIYQRRDCKLPMTPHRMEQYLGNILGIEVHVMDIHDQGEYGYIPEYPNMFKVTLVGEGTLDAKSVRKELDKIKQSHTIYSMSERIYDIVDNRRIETIALATVAIQTRCQIMVGKCSASVIRCRFESKAVKIGETASVTTRRNLWRLDGSVRLNGSRTLNAMERKENL